VGWVIEDHRGYDPLECSSWGFGCKEGWGKFMGTGLKSSVAPTTSCIDGSTASYLSYYLLIYTSLPF